jgi:nitrite reductase/ring-hydroxylating ferredoxin subunit
MEENKLMVAIRSNEPAEFSQPGEAEGLAGRILDGEVFILRRGLQTLGLLDDLIASSLEGIRKSVGPDVAARARRDGFDRIHEWIDAADLPGMTEAVYLSVAKPVRAMLEQFIRKVFPGEGNYYYEKSPNVRFHIPYELAARHQSSFNRFADSRGQGKITAHGPHRDSWVDCPDNVVNIWIAIGPVRRGNGLTIFAQDYREQLAFRNGYLAPNQALHMPMTFDLEPGDVILFHSDHVHGSELNVTDSTRFAISHRITFGKPHFPYGHYHHYLHAGLAAGPLWWLAQVPANLQRSYVADRLRRLMWKAGLLKSTGSKQASSGDEGSGESAGQEVVELSNAGGSVAVADLPIGAIRAVSKSLCVARLGEDEFVAMSRRCPHAGGDLASGWIADARPVCPMHNLSFDPKTGAAACRALAPLKVYACSIRGNRLHVDMREAEGSGV